MPLDLEPEENKRHITAIAGLPFMATGWAVTMDKEMWITLNAPEFIAIGIDP